LTHEKEFDIMSGAKRKIQRAQEKRAHKDLKEKMFMFDRLEDECLVCNKSFDKKNKEQVQSWNVVVRKEENKVNLYCPECWQNAIDIIKEYTGKQK
jgi:uncharacterized protein with PIN domain